MHRKKLLVSAIAVVAALGLSRASLPVAKGFPGASPDTEIRHVLDSQQEAWNRADIPAFLHGYWNSPDLTFSGANGTVRGYEGLLNRYQKSYPTPEAMGHLDFSGLQIRQLGPDAALVLGKWHLKRTVGDIGGVFTLVFQRFPDGWKIVHDHTSQQKERNE